MRWMGGGGSQAHRPTRYPSPCRSQSPSKSLDFETLRGSCCGGTSCTSSALSDLHCGSFFSPGAAPLTLRGWTNNLSNLLNNPPTRRLELPPSNGCTRMPSKDDGFQLLFFVGKVALVVTPLSKPFKLADRIKSHTSTTEGGTWFEEGGGCSFVLVLWFSLGWTAAAKREAAGETRKSGITTVKEATFTGAPPLFLRAGVKEGHSRRRRRVCSGGGCCSGLSWRSQYSSLVVPARG
jgi:hypothetical protein